MGEVSMTYLPKSDDLERGANPPPTGNLPEFFNGKKDIGQKESATQAMVSKKFHSQEKEKEK
jgi:hypothetical protein